MANTHACSRQQPCRCSNRRCSINSPTRHQHHQQTQKQCKPSTAHPKALINNLLFLAEQEEFPRPPRQPPKDTLEDLIENSSHTLIKTSASTLKCTACYGTHSTRRPLLNNFLNTECRSFIIDNNLTHILQQQSHR